MRHFQHALAWEEVAEPEAVGAHAAIEVKATDAAQSVPVWFAGLSRD